MHAVGKSLSRMSPRPILRPPRSWRMTRCLRPQPSQDSPAQPLRAPGTRNVRMSLEGSQITLPPPAYTYVQSRRVARRRFGSINPPTVAHVTIKQGLACRFLPMEPRLAHAPPLPRKFPEDIEGKRPSRLPIRSIFCALDPAGLETPDWGDLGAARHINMPQR